MTSKGVPSKDELAKAVVSNPEVQTTDGGLVNELPAGFKPEEDAKRATKLARGEVDEGEEIERADGGGEDMKVSADPALTDQGKED